MSGEGDRMEMDEDQVIARLAMRHEGKWWNAYCARSDTMTDAVLLGSIQARAVTGNPARQQAFMELMSGLIADIIEASTGHRPTVGEFERAPEHERAGNS